MKTCPTARQLGFVVGVFALIATACSATGTVTLSDATLAQADRTEQDVAASTNAADQATAPQDSSEADDAAAANPDAAQSADAADDTNDDADSADSGNADDSDDAVADAPDDAAPFSFPAAGAPVCRFDRVDTFDDIQIELAFTNPLIEKADGAVAYELFDGSGELISAGDAFFEQLVPGERVRAAIDTLTDAPTGRAARARITCEIVSIEPSPFGSSGLAPGPADSCAFVEVDSFGDVQVLLNVVSPLDNPAELTIDYALRGPDGVRFGDGLEFTAEVGPRERTVTASDTFTNLPNWVAESTFTCEILSIQEF